MYGYGNARIAARRGRLLAPEALERLAESGTLPAATAQLERLPEWRRAIDAARQGVADPAGVLRTAVELHRAAELAALPRWYDGPARRLVEALVMQLDLERLVALLRRRSAGQDAEAINPTLVRGAVLGGDQLADLARLPGSAAVYAALARRGLLAVPAAQALAVRARQGEPAELERLLGAAWEEARFARAGGGGADAASVRQALAEDAEDRAAVAVELAEGSAAGASLVERSLVLDRAERRARRARRDPEGIGPVIGYVAAIDAQAVRLRVILERLAAGWSRHVARAFLEERATPAPSAPRRRAGRSNAVAA
jgi:vacuolar-type H+-ATPase subunit C/Vma6